MHCAGNRVVRTGIPLTMLEGKVIVIVGGTSGIGLSAAKACIAHGAHVVAVGKDDEYASTARGSLGPNAHVLTGDATHPDTAAAAIAHARSAFGCFDALYHVAGGSGRRFGDGPLHACSDAGWAETIALNQTSVFYSNRAAIVSFLEAGTGGVLLNMASVLAFAPAPAHFAAHAYAAAKAAIIGITRAAAAHYAPHNIRVNAIAPGCTDTPMAGRARGDAAIQDYLARKQPLDGGRMGVPEDLDAAAVFLLSDASRFVTGQVLAVDGGWSVTEAGP